MARPAINSFKLTDTLTLSECHPTFETRGAWWLYDKTQGMNLAVGAQTREEAFLSALNYYQRRLKQVETDYEELQKKVNSFLVQFSEEEGETE